MGSSGEATGLVYCMCRFDASLCPLTAAPCTLQLPAACWHSLCTPLLPHLTLRVSPALPLNPIILPRAGFAAPAVGGVAQDTWGGVVFLGGLRTGGPAHACRGLRCYSLALSHWAAWSPRSSWPVTLAPVEGKEGSWWETQALLAVLLRAPPHPLEAPGSGPWCSAALLGPGVC